jgi:transposase
MPMVCVQPLVSSWARRGEDLTFDKTDDKDAVLIARLTAQLRCYVPEPVDETWGRLRHLGARREQLVADMISHIQQMRDLLGCVWPAVLETAKQPFGPEPGPPPPPSHSAVTAATSPAPDASGWSDSRPRSARSAALGCIEAVSADRASRIHRPVRPGGVLAHRPGALERVAFVLADRHESRRRCADTEIRMTGLLDELQSPPTSIRGLSPVGAAAILAGTGNLHRFTSARALVKHAGLAPREKASGAFVGRTKVTGQGRPGLRLAAWRTGWAAIKGNEVYAARFAHLAAREGNKLSPTQAQTALAAALLRQLHAIVTTGRRWDPEIASQGMSRRAGLAVAA